MSISFRTKFFAHDWSSSMIGPVSTWSEQLRMSLEFMLDTYHPMFIIWGTNKTLFFNETFSEMLGERAFEALGEPANEIWSEVWHSLQPIVEPALEGQSILREDTPFKTWASNYSETRFYTLTSTPIRSLDGSVVATSCLCIDTTEKVAARVRTGAERNSLYRLFQETPGFVTILEGPEHRFAFANSAYLRMVGREVVGFTVAEIMPELIIQGFVDRLDTVYTTGERFVAHRMPINFHPVGGGDVETRFVNFIYEAMRNENHEIEGVFVEGHDVTHEVAAEQTVRLLQTELIYLARVSAMGTMAATLAHELNQPFAAIMNYAAGLSAELDSDDSGSKTIRAGVEGIERSATRAGNVIRSLRQMTRRTQESRSNFNMEALCKEVISLVKVGSCGRVEISCDFAPGGEAFGDGVQIQQVLINLIKNACEAIEADDCPKVTVSTRLLDDGLQISVEDNGPGVSVDILENLFGSFVSTKPGGMGMGLSISRTIIEAHRGRISVLNKPGGGAAFSFVLPINGEPTDLAA